MDFSHYLSQSKAVGPQQWTEVLVERFSQLVARGHSAADLLAHYDDDFGHLPAEQLRALVQKHRQWQRWRRRKNQLDQARDQAGLPPLPAQIFTGATTVDELDAIVRTARVCQRADAPDERTWVRQLRGGLCLWRACLALARKRGAVRCEAVSSQNSTANARFDMYVATRLDFADLPAHRWLALRRGVKEKILELTVELPDDQLLEQVELHRGDLGEPATGRLTASLLDELVLDDLRPWLLTILDGEAEAEAIRSACEALAGLLRGPVNQARCLAAVHIGRPKTALAVAVVDREGEIIAHKSVNPQGQWAEEIIGLIVEHKAQQVALPTSAAASELLTSLEVALGEAGLPVQRVRTAALAEARRPYTSPPTRLSSSIASALVLARRALDPLREWAAVDPVSIGIAEYQHDLDADRLRTALVETVEICRLERRRGKGGQNAAPAARAHVARSKLNPLVKTIADLRPGMDVHGVVTNISHFGAFVSVGLQNEALVHISELSDDFVSNPNEIVSLGQQVRARVLSVDHQRGRISLSMRSTGRRPGGAGGESKRSEGPPRAGGQASSTSRPRTRSEALANLEKLFKK